jgi:hypothetical protein
MEEIIYQYYGIDIIAALITFTGIYLLGDKNRYGFIVTLIGNIIWLFFGVMTSSIGILIANIGFALLNVRGYIKWKK